MFLCSKVTFSETIGKRRKSKSFTNIHVPPFIMHHVISLATAPKIVLLHFEIISHSLSTKLEGNVVLMHVKSRERAEGKAKVQLNRMHINDSHKKSCFIVSTLKE